MNIQIAYKILDADTIEFYCDEALEFKVVINVAYRGVDGSVDGGSSLTQTQMDNLNYIPNIKVDVEGLKNKDEELAAVVYELGRRLDLAEYMLDDNVLLKNIESLSKEQEHTINAKTIDKKILQSLAGIDMVNVNTEGSYDANTGNLGSIPG